MLAEAEPNRSKATPARGQGRGGPSRLGLIRWSDRAPRWRHEGSAEIPAQGHDHEVDGHGPARLTQLLSGRGRWLRQPRHADRCLVEHPVARGHRRAEDHNWTPATSWSPARRRLDLTQRLERELVKNLDARAGPVRVSELLSTEGRLIMKRGALICVLGAISFGGCGGDDSSGSSSTGGTGGSTGGTGGSTGGTGGSTGGSGGSTGGSGGSTGGAAGATGGSAGTGGGSGGARGPRVEPLEPAARPEELAARPEELAARPEEPAARPEELAARPEEPAARPEEPAARPEEPAARPEEPAEPAAAARAGRRAESRPTSASIPWRR